MTLAIKIRAIIAAMALTAGIGLSSAGHAAANPALVVDVATGQVLYGRQATEPWFPASITKLMTTYMVLNAVKSGRLSLDTPLVVSARAAAERPSKMGFRPGTVVTVDNALKMMLVKSANDLAVVFAEGVSGSVEAFADEMNRTAQQLGMHDSNFVNPNGMPDDRQRISARDIALLARALMTDFPEYRQYFGIGAIRLGRRIIQNTNGLIGRYPGADGMKTGFICSSGFNVVATATRNGRQLLAVVLGAPTAAARTIEAAELFDRGFAQPAWGGPRLQDLPTSSVLAPPDIHDEVCGPNRGQALADDDEAGAPVMGSAAGGNGNDQLMLRTVTPGSGVAAVRGPRPNTLAPRARFTPIAVFVGRTPGADPGSQVADGEAKTAGPKGRKVLAIRKAPRDANAFAQSDDAKTSSGASLALEKVIQDAPKLKGKAATAKAKPKEAEGKKVAQKPKKPVKAVGDAAKADN